MKGIGLVFAGGGGKGAYEIGVWKYLHEMGLDQYVRVVSGTSVGALNAALFVGSSYKLAEKLWLTISRDKILTSREISSKDIVKWLISSSMLSGISQIIPQTSLFFEKIARLMIDDILGDHMFSRKGMIKMINDGLNFDRLKSSSIPCYVTCLKCQDLQTERFLLNEYSEQNITKLLLATSAIPLIFSNEEFQGQKYCDGGLPLIGDNVPVEPVYKTGVEYILVIHLNQDYLIDKKQFPDSKIIEIVPSQDLGNILTGTLNFESEESLARINLGYEDAKRVMQPLVDMMLINTINQKMLEVEKQKNFDFERKRQVLLNKEKEIKENMAHDNFDVIFNNLIGGKK